MELLREIVHAVEQPAMWLVQPEKRIYFGYLVSAAALAGLVWRRQSARGSLGRYLFTWRIWRHRSSLLDLRLIVTRGLFGLVLVTPRVFGALAVAAAVAHALDGVLGGVDRSSANMLVSVLFTLAVFVVDDFSSFLVHRMMHRVPLLWEIHKVHHSAEVMTPLTVYRVHPLEGWFNQLRGALSTGVVAGVFVHFAPGPLHAVTIAGVDVLGIAFSVLGANLRHSHVHLSWGSRAEHLFISPAMHQIHHGRRREHHERNFGSALALWDWLFGSLRVASHSDRIRFGLFRSERNHHPAKLTSVLLGPLGAILRTCLAPFRKRGVRELPFHS